MQAANFERAIDLLVARDPRYQREAYLFVREALDYTQQTLKQSGQERLRQAAGQEFHVTAQQLLGGVRACALEAFGPMALGLFHEWGVDRCEDFGEIVFNMVECGLLAKTDKDTREDFKDGYDFVEAFRKPFLPKTRADAPPPPQPKASDPQG